MNIVLSIIYPAGLKILTDIHQNLRLPFTMVLHGRGTATDRMLDLLGIESRENRIVLTVADPQKTRELIEEQRRVLYLGMPGNGLVIALPIVAVFLVVKHDFGEDGSHKELTPTQEIVLPLCIGLGGGLYEGVIGAGAGTFMLMAFTLQAF